MDSKTRCTAVAALVLAALLAAPPVGRADVQVEITADNAYGFGWGDGNGLLNYFGGVENFLASQIFNCSTGPESYTIPSASACSGNFLYIVAWADKSTTQGVLARFQSDAAPPIYTGVGPWEVCATGIDYDPGSGGPTVPVIDDQIVACNAGTGDPATTSRGWVDAVGTADGQLAIGEFNNTPRGPVTVGNEFPLTCVARLDEAARWMWFNWDPANIMWPTSGSPFIWPGGSRNVTKDFLIFRLPADALPQLTCEPKTQGFWKRQCAVGKRPHPSGETANLPGYVPCVAATATFGSVSQTSAMCDELHPFPPNDKCQQAEAQFMALLLNQCSSRLSGGCCVNEGTATVNDAIAQIDALLSNPLRTFADCVQAQGLAASINEGTALCEADVDPCL